MCLFSEDKSFLHLLEKSVYSTITVFLNLLKENTSKTLSIQWETILAVCMCTRMAQNFFTLEFVKMLIELEYTTFSPGRVNQLAEASFQYTTVAGLIPVRAHIQINL